jgi:hypothetical protein
VVVFSESKVGGRKTTHELQIMPEYLQNLERAAISPTVLIGLGTAAVLSGLFLWIGGLGFRRILAAILGAVSGGILGLFIIGHNIAALVLAATAASIAIILERVFITILAAGLAAGFALIILAYPHIEKSDAATPPNNASEQNLTVSVGESLKILKAYTVDCIDRIKQACLKMPAYNWLITAALVVIFIVAGLYLYRLASAFCCATVGTTLIFAGMILLLLYKTSAPISHIYHNSPFYLVIFAGMIIFGTLEQLLICKSPKRQPTGKKQENKLKQTPAERTHRWRTM